MPKQLTGLDLARELQNVSLRLIESEKIVSERKEQIKVDQDKLAQAVEQVEKARKAFTVLLDKVRGEK